MTKESLPRAWRSLEGRVRSFLERLTDKQRYRFLLSVPLLGIGLTSVAGVLGVWPLTLLVALGGGVVHWRFSLLRNALEQQRQTSLLQRLKDHAQGKASGAKETEDCKAGHEVEELLEQARQCWVVPRQEQDRQVHLLAALIDATPSGIVFLDDVGRVAIINQTARDLFRNAENTIKGERPEFSAANLDGCLLFEQLGHPELLATEDAGTASGVNLSIGGATLRVTRRVLQDDQGQQFGTITEWLNNSAQINAEQQVQRLIGRAVSGNLDERLELEGMEGFMHGLGKGINMLMEAVQSPLQAIKDVQVALAAGDLSKHMEGLFLGEFGSVQTATNRSISHLTDLVGKVRASADAVEQTAGTLRQGNDLLEQRTNEQVDALDSAASAVEELTSIVKNNAENSHSANQHASTTHDKAERGRDVAQTACVAMENIKQSSREISQVVSVMGEIAFQTKLLSLNAAIEAAYAGEHGRGFAVVAGEVRTLAERSSTAAKEIDKLTAQSIKRIEEGVAQVSHVSMTLDQIADEVNTVSALMSDIATASQEQYLGTEQLERSVVAVLQGLQKNQELVNEVTASSKSLNTQAEALVSLISFFKVDPTLALETALEGPSEFITEEEPVAVDSAPRATLAAEQPDEQVERDDFMIEDPSVPEPAVSAATGSTETDDDKSGDSAEELDFFV